VWQLSYLVTVFSGTELLSSDSFEWDRCAIQEQFWIWQIYSSKSYDLLSKFSVGQYCSIVTVLSVTDLFPGDSFECDRSAPWWQFWVWQICSLVTVLSVTHLLSSDSFECDRSAPWWQFWVWQLSYLVTVLVWQFWVPQWVEAPAAVVGMYSEEPAWNPCVCPDCVDWRHSDYACLKFMGKYPLIKKLVMIRNRYCTFVFYLKGITYWVFYIYINVGILPTCTAWAMLWRKLHE